MRTPKISANKLGEYLTATASRRKRIIEDQQNPKPFITARYSEARKEIVNYLANNMANEEAMLNAAHELRTTSGATDFIEQDRRASADAIEDFLDASEQLNLEGFVVEPGDVASQKSMEVCGVEISMRPDAIIKKSETQEVVGALKLHFPKTNPLNEKSAEYVATALRVHLENTESNAKIDHKKCYVVDVSTGLVANAPKAHKRKMNDIAAACEEIKARWKK